MLGPLGMTGSSFPAGWPHEDPDAVTGYELEPDGTFVPDLDDVTAILLAAGLWTTAADLVRFGTGWSSLLPADLASEALRPQDPGHIGLGWRLNLADGIRLGGRRRPRRERVPDRQAQRQPRLRRADQPEGAHPGP